MAMVTRCTAVGLCLAMLVGSKVVAADTDVDPALQDLLQILDQETELATRTKMNIDFVPGMMSVMHGADLVNRGVRTVFEALSLVPGVEISKSYDGQLQVIVRGVGKTFSSGKIKILLNGVAYNAMLNANSVPLLLPVELVSRIEVIRGPGSVIYGEFASVAVINIITLKDGNRVHIRRSDPSSGSIGGNISQLQVTENVTLNVAFAQQYSRGGDVDSGNDILASAPQPLLSSLSNAPGKVNDAEQSQVFILDAIYKDYSLLWQYVERGYGDYFGLANALSDDDNEIMRRLYMHNLQLSYDKHYSSVLNATTKLGWSTYGLDSNQYQLYPSGFLDKDSEVFTDGVLGAADYEEDKFYAGAEGVYQGITGHRLLGGIEYIYTRQGDTDVQRNYAVVGSQLDLVENAVYKGDDNWLEEGLTRSLVALYVQDQYALTERWELIAGLRLDRYDDIGQDLTPRIASVYRFADHKTFKVQVAESFRPPTFLEMYAKNNPIVEGNPDLSSERLRNLEFGYIYNDGVVVGRITGFFYRLMDLIAVDYANHRYENTGAVDAHGVELEYQLQIDRHLRFDFNITHINASLDDADIPGIARNMGNVGLLLHPWPDYNFTLQYRFVGDRLREQGDSREPLEGYQLVDLHASIANLAVRGFSMRVGIKNLFDREVRYPSFLTSFANEPTQRPAYTDDYPQRGREFVLQVAYEF